MLVRKISARQVRHLFTDDQWGQRGVILPNRGYECLSNYNKYTWTQVGMYITFLPCISIFYNDSMKQQTIGIKVNDKLYVIPICEFVQSKYKRNAQFEVSQILTLECNIARSIGGKSL